MCMGREQTTQKQWPPSSLHFCFISTWVCVCAPGTHVSHVWVCPCVLLVEGGGTHLGAGQILTEAEDAWVIFL